MNVFKNAMTLLFTQTNPRQPRKEMLGIFLAIFNKMDKKFKIEYILLIEVSTKSEIVMHAIVKTLIERARYF